MTECKSALQKRWQAFKRSEVFLKIIPEAQGFLAPVGSTQIRNMATVAGNLVNASPIGDLTIMLLALNGTVHLFDGTNERPVPLRDFYLGYKSMDKQDGEVVQKITFPLPDPSHLFSFQRVCKRTYLDVASVNSACLIILDADQVIRRISISAGGVGPTPMYLNKTCQFLQDKVLNKETVLQAQQIAQSEISPISDVRGSADYKKQLLRQLIWKHMMKAGMHITPDELQMA